jgi:hypothetical protein
MTDTTERQVEAVALIDGKLAELQRRELVSATEVADLLLDLRLLLAVAEEPEALVT